MSIRIEIAAKTNSQLGEGAFWDVHQKCLWWVDIVSGLIHKYCPNNEENKTYEFNEPVGCLAPRKNGGLVLAAKSGFWLFDPETGLRTAILDPEEHMPENRFNDGATDMQGRFWAGTMKDGGASEQVGAFYRLDPDLSVTKWRDDFFTTNGMAFSPDGRKMYCSDSNAEVRKIWSYDYDVKTGTPTNERLFFDTQNVAGRPDGGTVDADGCYWQAGVSGWQIYRISPEGELLLTIDVPIEKPTKPMFGGENLDILYVTSLSMGLDPAREQPDAGSLFAIHDLGIQGIPQVPFAG